MKIGYHKQNITPNTPVHMAGYNRKEKSNGILDEIMLNSMVLEINHEKFIFSIIDSIMLEKDFCDSLRKKVNKKYGIDMNKIFVSCIHTHSAPAYFKLTWEDTVVESDLTERLYNQVLDSVDVAIQNMQECYLELKQGYIEGLYGNRNKKEGWSDKSFYVFEFKNQHDTICQLVNISVHPTLLNGKNYLLSSDLLGAVRRKYQIATQVPTMITNGATGDVSTRFYRQSSGIDELENVSDQIVEQIMHKSKCVMSLRDDVSLCVDSLEYKTCSDFSQDDVTLNMLRDNTQGEMVEFFKDRCRRKLNLGRFEMIMTSNIVLLDRLLIISLPGDVVSGFAKKIKEIFSDYIVVLICYTNGYCNYLVCENEYGQYFETYNSRCMRGEADKFIDKVIQTAKNLL